MAYSIAIQGLLASLTVRGIHFPKPDQHGRPCSANQVWTVRVWQCPRPPIYCFWLLSMLSTIISNNCWSWLTRVVIMGRYVGFVPWKKPTSFPIKSVRGNPCLPKNVHLNNASNICFQQRESSIRRRSPLASHAHYLNGN